MKKLILLFNLFIISALALAQEDEYPTLTQKQETQAIGVANLWLEEIFKAEDVEKLMKISDVPFAVGQDEVLTHRTDLEKFYKEVFADKGKRPVPQLDPQVSEYRSEILEECIPLNFVKVEIVVGEEDDRDVVIVCVALKDDEYKVVGFND